MLKTLILFFISIFFVIIKKIYLGLFKRKNFQTLPGYLLLKINKKFLKFFVSTFNCPVVFITGTNGKTSTTSLLYNILISHNLRVLTNLSGSNLKRGVLSSVLLSYYKFVFNKPNILLFEVDEGSVQSLANDFNTTNTNKYIVVLNLSRDQLDRYGEVDILAKKIKTSSIENNFKIVSDKYCYYSILKPQLLPTLLNSKDIINTLNLHSSPHLISNFSYINSVLNDLNIKLLPSKISQFTNVPGRGNTFNYLGCYYNLNLSKNPASFNTSLNSIYLKDATDVLILLNDNIPDGRDVSWIYDINYSLLQKKLNGKTIYVGGTRSYDLLNLLKILKIPSFNFLSFENYSIFAKKTKINKTFVLANYSATSHILKNYAK